MHSVVCLREGVNDGKCECVFVRSILVTGDKII